MSTENFKITIHMVASLDGFVVKNDGDVSWLKSTDTYDDGVDLTEEEINSFLDSVDCYVMGSGTYEHAMELGWPYGDVPVIVMTSRVLTSDRESVEFYKGDIQELVNNRLRAKFENVWMVGGPTLAKEFIRESLVDEIVVSLMPVIIGEGKLYFDYIGKEQRLHLKECKAYKDGMVELTYEVIKKDK